MVRTPLRILSNDYSGNTSVGGVIRGGTEVFARDISKRLIADGHHWIGVIANRDSAFGVVTSQKRAGATYISVGFGPIASKVRDVVGRRDPCVVFRREIECAKRIIRDAKPDIVFLNGFYTMPWILFEAAVELGVPTVVQHAGIWAKEVRMYPDVFSPDARRLAYRIERRSAEAADVNVFLNEMSRDVFRAALRVGSIAGEVIIELPHPGWRFVTQSARVREREASKRAQKFIVGCVARWDRIKNHEGLLAFAEAVRELALPITVRVVTSIPDTKKNAAFKKRYRSVLDIVAPVNRDELVHWYDSLDAVVVPSHFETGPFIVMEAAARGVPTAISPHVGWVSEYKRRGMGEWILNFDRPYAAARRLHKLLKAGQTNSTTKFAKWIEIGHSPETVYQSYLRLFRRTASR